MAEWEADLDPERVRFTHARIRPLFSDGRPVLETLAALRDGSLQLSELPKILVHERDGYYYSINNRRLWVLKELHKDGLLPKGKIPARVRSAAACLGKRQLERYTPDRCSAEARFMGGGGGGGGGMDGAKDKDDAATGKDGSGAEDEEEGREEEDESPRATKTKGSSKAPKTGKGKKGKGKGRTGKAGKAAARRPETPPSPPATTAAAAATARNASPPPSSSSSSSSSSSGSPPPSSSGPRNLFSMLALDD